MCLLHHAVLHPDANIARHVVSPSLVDLSSTFIPFDDDEEEDEEEETYDDIEGVGGPSLPQPGAGQVPHSGKRRGGQEMGEDNDEEDDDIYEVLPGMRMWLSRMQRYSNIHPHAGTETGRRCTHKPSWYSVRQINAVALAASHKLQP